MRNAVSSAAYVNQVRKPHKTAERKRFIGRIATRIPDLLTSEAHSGARDSVHSGTRDSIHSGARSGVHSGTRDGVHGGTRDSIHSGVHSGARDSVHSGARDAARGDWGRLQVGIGSVVMGNGRGQDEKWRRAYPW